MKIIKTLAIFLFLTIFIMAMPVFATVQISPERFEYTVKADQKYINGFFTIKVTGNEPVRYRVYKQSFDISQNGTLINSNIQNLAYENIRFNPKEVTVIPGKHQKIRFTIINPTSLPDGESRVVIFLEDTKTRMQTLYNKEKNVAASINLKTRIGIPIYIDNGKYIKSAELEKFSINQHSEECLYSLAVKSTGNSKVRVNGKIQIIKDKQLIEEVPITSQPVQGGTTGKITGNIPVEKLVKGQKYLVKLNINYKDQQGKTQYIIKESFIDLQEDFL